MSQRTTICHRFKGIQSLAVTADFGGGDVTSDAGALLLREAARQTDLISDLSRAIHDSRDKAYVTHDVETMLTQRVIGIACGYEDGNDHALANQPRLLLSSAAYLLIEHMRRTALAGTELAKAQCSTIRCKLLKIGAVIVRNTRRIRIQMAGHYLYQSIFMKAAVAPTST